MVFEKNLNELNDAFSNLKRLLSEDIINEPNIKQIKIKPKDIGLLDSLKNGYAMYSEFDPYLSNSTDIESNLGNIECTCNTGTSHVDVDSIEKSASILFKYSHEYLVQQAAKTVVFKVIVKESMFFNMNILPFKDRKKTQFT